MTNSTVEVTTPSRLHFGMFSFGTPTLRQFGGIGLMIDAPSTRLRMARAAEFECVGPDAERLKHGLDAVRQTSWGATLAACRLEILKAPQSHVGLGSGTQLALAVTAGLRAWMGLPPLTATE